MTEEEYWSAYRQVEEHHLASSDHWNREYLELLDRYGLCLCLQLLQPWNIMAPWPYSEAPMGWRKGSYIVPKEYP